MQTVATNTQQLLRYDSEIKKEMLGVVGSSPPPQRPLCIVGRLGRQKKKAWGAGGRFPSSHRSPRAFYFIRLLLFLWGYPAGASAEERMLAQKFDRLNSAQQLPTARNDMQQHCNNSIYVCLHGALVMMFSQEFQATFDFQEKKQCMRFLKNETK